MKLVKFPAEFPSPWPPWLQQDQKSEGPARGPSAHSWATVQVPSGVPAARPTDAASSAAATFFPSSALAFRTSIRPPWAVTKKLVAVTSDTSPTLPFTAPKVRKRCLRASKSWIFLPFRVVHAPGAGLRPADQVVDEVDVARPVDPRLGGPAPALVRRLVLVLDGLLVLARGHEVGRFEHRLHAQREEPVEVDRAERVVRADRRLLLQDHRPLVEAVGRAEDRQPGLRLAPDDRPVDRARAAILGQQRRVILDRSALRDA